MINLWADFGNLQCTDYLAFSTSDTDLRRLIKFVTSNFLWLTSFMVF